MLQFYFLSVLLNLLAGFILFYTSYSSDSDEVLNADDNEQKKLPEEKKSFLHKIFGKNSFTDDEMFYLVVGILSIFVGFIKLLSSVNGSPFFGDLLPALAGFFGGTALLILYFEKKSQEGLVLNHTLNLIFVESRKYLGIACIAIAFLHFILPGVLFL